MIDAIKKAATTTKKAATKSWATTAIGIVGALGMILSGLYAQFDGNPETVVSSWFVLLGQASTLAGIGVASRDHGVSSEDAGVK